jgi:hypothetical protein
MLDPAIMGKVLGKLTLRHGDTASLPIEEDGAGAGSTLVNGQEI